MSSESQYQNRGRVLSILDASQDAWIFNQEEFNSVLDTVGNRPVAIYSINGEARGGKSFLLNYFIRHFEEQLGNSADEIPASELFESGSGVGRVTVGINLWSKPYFVTTDVGEVAVLLLDTQGLFDPQTPFRKNALIFTISCFLSSVMMYNQKGALLENVLADIQRFSNFANQLSYNKNLTVTRESGSLIDTSNKLLFIMRDFDVPDYSYGLHNEHGMPQEEETDRNYFSDVLSSSTAGAGAMVTEESREIRRRLLNLYSDVSAYLLPHPGKNFVRRRQLIPDDDFENETKNFVRTNTSRNYIAKKVILGDTVTSARFKLCIKSMVEICTQASDYFANLISMRENDELTRSTRIVNDAVALYETELNAFISSHPEGVTATIFEGAHCDAERRSRDLQRDQMVELGRTYIHQMEERIEALRSRFEELNNNNIFYSNLRSIVIGTGAVLATAGACGAALPVIAAAVGAGAELASIPAIISAGAAAASSNMLLTAASAAIRQSTTARIAAAAVLIADAIRTPTVAAAEPAPAAVVAVGSPAEINAAAPGVVPEDADAD